MKMATHSDVPDALTTELETHGARQREREEEKERLIELKIEPKMKIEALLTLTQEVRWLLKKRYVSKEAAEPKMHWPLNCLEEEDRGSGNEVRWLLKK